MAPFSVSDLRKRTGDAQSSLEYNPPHRGVPPSSPARPRASITLANPGSNGGEADAIDWANLSYEDKQVFFSWLDEFFSRYTGRPISSFAPTSEPEVPIATDPAPATPTSPPLPRRTTSQPPSATPPDVVPPPMPPRRTSSQASYAAIAPEVAPPPMPPRRSSSQVSLAPPMPPRRGSNSPSTPPGNGPPRRAMPPPPPTSPPRLNFGTRPGTLSRSTPPAQGTAPGADPLIDLRMSYPAIPAHGSNGADLAYYFSQDTQWGSGDNWYNTSSGTPPTPPGVPSDEMRGCGGSKITIGGTTTLTGSAMFADLSVCYYRVTFPSDPHSANDPRIRREAWYTLRPPSLPGNTLFTAYSLYGEIIASVAESYVGTGQKVLRGECWDLAYQALEIAREQCPDQAPVPSISRTHGHLIYCGRPGDGRWRGGDRCVRRGDIVQWRSVRTGKTKRGPTTILGAPDHTAVIVRDCIPSIPVSDGCTLTPAQLGDLSIVGQNPNPPKFDTISHAFMTEGEMWIYRPICMRDYVGSEFEITPPPGAPVIAI
ncbi:hypothetical protein PENSPDRAFT_756132 [Peniophora sp. CONT]|nr:hypothetical protein PENSPDRAFT_756132 [Peniophora sp. CONT]